MWEYREAITNPNQEWEERSEFFSQELSYARHSVRGQECNRLCLHEASCLEGMTSTWNRVIDTVPGVGQHPCAMYATQKRGMCGAVYQQDDHLWAEPQNKGRNSPCTRRWPELVVIKRSWSAWKDWRSGSKVDRIIWVRGLLLHGVQYGAPLQEWRVFTEIATQSPRTSTWSQILQPPGCLPHPAVLTCSSDSGCAFGHSWNSKVSHWKPASWLVLNDTYSLMKTFSGPGAWIYGYNVRHGLQVD